MTATTARAPGGVLDDRLDDLLQRIGQADRAAFSELYDRAAARVFAAIRRQLIDRAQSEEVAQEVFLEIWQTARRYDANRAGAMTWILTMARQRAIDRVRSEQAGRERIARVGIRDYPAPFDDVAETVETRLAGADVHAALLELTAQQREAITLAYYGGHSHGEIARMLGLPLGTVKTRLRSGMLRLRRELAAA